MLRNDPAYAGKAKRESPRWPGTSASIWQGSTSRATGVADGLVIAYHWRLFSTARTENHA